MAVHISNHNFFKLKTVNIRIYLNFYAFLFLFQTTSFISLPLLGATRNFPQYFTKCHRKYSTGTKNSKSQTPKTLDNLRMIKITKNKLLESLPGALYNCDIVPKTNETIICSQLKFPNKKVVFFSKCFSAYPAHK